MSIKLQIARDRALSRAEGTLAVARCQRFPQALRDEAARENRKQNDLLKLYNRMIETLEGAA